MAAGPLPVKIRYELHTVKGSRAQRPVEHPDLAAAKLGKPTASAGNIFLPF